MKRLFSLFSLLLISLGVYAQSHLRISNIINLPVAPDTAYEAASYDSIVVTVVNDGTAQFVDNLSILISDTTQSWIDTLVNAQPVSIAMGDSATLLQNSYVFHASYFDDGDNIVVVWPRAVTVPVQVDSNVYQINFVSIASGTNDLENESILLFPNPATRFIKVNEPDEMAIKQVRIYDARGKEFYRNSNVSKMIPIEDLPAGIYFIEIQKADGRLVRSFIKN